MALLADSTVRRIGSLLASCDYQQRMLLVLSLTAVLPNVLGCSDNNTSPGPMGPRNSTTTFQSNGQPIVRADCRYIGKGPDDSIPFINSHNFRTIDTDFYRLTLTNLTDRNVELTGLSYHMAKGPLRIPKQASLDKLRKHFGSLEIPSGESRTHLNTFVWSPANQNALRKTYRFRTNDDQGAEIEFEGTVVLQYAK